MNASPSSTVCISSRPMLTCRTTAPCELVVLRDIAAFARWPNGGMIVTGSAWANGHRHLIAQHKLTAVLCPAEPEPRASITALPVNQSECQDRPMCATKGPA